VGSVLLLTRPNHDLPTTYLYHWSELVIKEASNKGIKVLDLEGKKANKSQFSSYISKNKPELLFLNGHGAKDCVGGYDNEILLDSSNCEALLKGKILYVRSCEAGAVLGPFSIGKGAAAFIGYSRSYWLIRSISKSTRPLNDSVAKLFLEPSNQVPISLIKGRNVKESYDKSQKEMRRNFSYMISSKASIEERDAAFFLFANLSCQVMYGQGTAKL